MHAQQLHTILLLLSVVISLFLVIAAAKYAEWARVMVTGSGNWLGLVFYLASVPILSLFYASSYLAMLHLNIISTDSITPLASSKPSITLAAATFLFAMSIIQFIWWLIQASLCTACEMAPILAGHQGQVPKWCPQSKFIDKGIEGLPSMLANLAIVKDSASWAMVVLCIALIECARRGWARARQSHGIVSIGIEPDYETGGWKGPAAMPEKNEAYEMGHMVKSERFLPKASGDRAARPGYAELGGFPSRAATVAVNLDTGASYESRI